MILRMLVTVVSDVILTAVKGPTIAPRTYLWVRMEGCPQENPCRSGERPLALGMVYSAQDLLVNDCNVFMFSHTICYFRMCPSTYMKKFTEEHFMLPEAASSTSLTPLRCPRPSPGYSRLNSTGSNSLESGYF